MATRPATRRFAPHAFALAGALLGLISAAIAAGAQEIDNSGVENGSITICDTQKQAERFVAHFKGNSQTAISAVNAEENNPTACVIANVSYIRGPQIGITRNRSDAFRIIPVIVVGVDTPTGMRPVSPAFFWVVRLKEFAV
jgi:hypothetical protein